jgi:hypothetical protein
LRGRSSGLFIALAHPRARPVDRTLAASPAHHHARAVSIHNLSKPRAVKTLAKVDRELADHERINGDEPGVKLKAKGKRAK